MKALLWEIFGIVAISVKGGEIMHFQFLIEDQSSAVLIEIIMKKISSRNEGITFNCKSFKGIGGFTKKNTVKETKSGKLLNDLATYLRGFNKSLQNIPAVIIVVLDNDTRNTKDFLAELNRVAQQNMIYIDLENTAFYDDAQVLVKSFYPGAKTALKKGALKNKTPYIGPHKTAQYTEFHGGNGRTRICDLLHVKQAL